MEGVIGYTTLFAGNFAPKNWGFCQGQILNIASNTALFSILGTTYGGNGTTTFGLPDLRGRSVVGVGQGPGLSSYSLGQVGGTQATTLNQLQLAAHVHPMAVTLQAPAASSANSMSPIDAVYAHPQNGAFLYAGEALTTMAAYNAPLTTLQAGGNQPFSNLQPILGLNYVICMQGVYPARN